MRSTRLSCKERYGLKWMTEQYGERFTHFQAGSYLERELFLGPKFSESTFCSRYNICKAMLALFIFSMDIALLKYDILVDVVTASSVLLVQPLWFSQSFNKPYYEIVFYMQVILSISVMQYGYQMRRCYCSLMV